MNETALLLHNAIAAVCPIVGVSIGTAGDPSTVRIDYASSATPAQQAAAQAVLAAFDWSNFAGYQANACATVDAKTAALLAAGFVYNGQQFGLTDTLKIKWSGIMLAAAGLTYPFQIATVSGQSYSLTSAADVQAWYVAGLQRDAQIEQGGLGIKAAIMAATTTAGVDAVEDARS